MGIGLSSGRSLPRVLVGICDNETLSKFWTHLPKFFLCDLRFKFQSANQLKIFGQNLDQEMKIKILEFIHGENLNYLCFVGVGLSLGNFFEVASGNPNDISMGTVFGMFILDIFFYSILTWYIDSVMPGQYGLARPWYFPFTVS